MSNKIFRIAGHIIGRKSRTGIAGLRVEAWDKDLICNDLVGSAITDEQGAFRIEFTHSYFQELFLDRRPDLFFKVFLADKLLRSTEDSVLWNVEAGDTQAILEVDPPVTVEPQPEPKPELFTVQGQIRQPDGSPLAGAIVRAFDKNMRSEEPLAEATTDAAGRYGIEYTAAQFRRAKKKNADLIVRVFDPQGQQLAASPVQFNAPSAATVDLTIAGNYRAPSEYEQLIEAITPVMQGIEPADLTEDDIAFITGETGVNRQHLKLLVTAARHARKTGLLPPTFYGLLRQNLPTDLLAQLANSPRDLRRALESSLRDNIAPPELENQLDAVLGGLQQALVKQALQPADGHGRFSLGDLLATSALSRSQQEQFVGLYVSRDGSVEDFWKNLGQAAAFQAPGTVEDLQFTIQLGSLTLNNVPLVRALQALRRAGTLKSLQDFVKLDSGAWRQVIDTPVDGKPIVVPEGVPGTTSEERTANYVSSMTRVLRDAFPTAAAAHSFAIAPTIDLPLLRTVLARNPQLDPGDFLPDSLDWTGISAADQPRVRESLEALRREIKMFPGFDYKVELADAVDLSGSRSAAVPAPFPNHIRDGVVTLLANSQDFDFRSTHVDSYIASHASTAFQGIREEHRPAVTDQLKRMQRVYRVAPRYEQIRDLMAEGLDSAYKIASVPRKTFLQKFENQWGGPAERMQVYSRAQHVMAATATVSAQVNQAINDVTPRVIGPQPKDVPNAIKAIPNWETLFRSLSFCECDHCRSAYGPAAYFVDLLQFLRRSASNAQHKTPLHVLLGRRPDLEYIRLSCENAETPLPYVDLVNEILETYVALGKLNASAAKDTGDTTADELSANPQYVNNKAYAKLREAVYPLTLPFSRPLEVARTYLEHLGSSRYQVMRTFQRDGKPSDLAIACEYLKIPPTEHAILTGTDLDGAPLASPPDLPELYGYSASDDWVASLHHVPEFLQRTGITYLDLIELVKTRFLNPRQDIRLKVSQNADPCDLSKTRIGPLHEGDLRKVYRFIRLWRKLGWQVRELDIAFAALAAEGYTSLLALARVKQLQADLNLPLDQLLSFWGGVDRDGRDCLYIRLFQNKAVLNPVDPGFALTYLTPLASLSGTPFPPDSVKDQASYDPAAMQLRFTGSMTDSQRGDLLKLSNDADFQLAIDNLYNMRDTPGIRLAGNDQSISEHLPTILAALRVSATDLEAIRAATGLADTDPNEPVPLKFAHLSTLYRHAALAKALQLSVNDFLALIALTGIDPFHGPASTALFVDKVAKLQQSAFSVSQLNYLYRDVSDPNQAVAPPQANVDLLMTNLQAGLRKVVDDTTVLPDPTGDLLRQKLGIVLDSSLVDPVMRLLDGTAVYSTPLASLSGAVFTGLPGPLQSRIAYDETAGMLRFTGAMTGVQRTALLGLSPDAGYQTAIENLFQQPRNVIADNLAGFLDPVHAVAPLINNPSFKPADRFDYVLSGLMTHLRQTLSRSLIKQTLGDSLKLDSMLTDRLLTDRDAAAALLKSRADATLPAIADFLALAPLPSNGSPPPPDSTQNAATSYRLLHKVALLVNSFKMTVEEVVYLSAHGADFAGRDPADPVNSAKFAPFSLNTLPLAPSAFQPALFSQWERLNALFALRDSLPQGEVGLLEVFRAASLPIAKKRLAEATGWDPAELHTLTGPGGFNLVSGDFKNEIELVTLQACWTLIKRLGASAKELFRWAAAQPAEAQAQDIQSIVKAKYDDETWLTIAKPLNDVLREKQKAALIAWLLADPAIKAAGITDSNGLFQYFLIDVDMSACMMTSRIVQACSSVQLFVQRCFLNLEDGKADPSDDVSPSAIDADQWQWMSQYRVWEANRKVFLYPENWILPELRDDKSPFFQELESELLQNDLTEDTAEQAILNYLEKLDEVARLEICGMYWQKDEEPDPVTFQYTQTLHVFARTFHSPHIYYYRRLAADTGVWTPWEKVQVDIEGDHLVPVVWNRRLCLFWPVFEEKADKNQDLGVPWLESTAHWRWRTAHHTWKRKHDGWVTADEKYKEEYPQYENDLAEFQALLNEHNLPAGSQSVRYEETYFEWVDMGDDKPPHRVQRTRWVMKHRPTPPNKPVEPLEPPEPSASQAPLTHWEIKLAWSEYKQNKWTAKQTSSRFIRSGNVTTNLGEVRDHPEDLGYQSGDTIVQLYLPTLEEHFLKTTTASGELVLNVYRRYQRDFDIFGDELSGRLQSYDYLGSFSTACGTKMRAVGEPFDWPFDSLAAPVSATNSFMTLADKTSAGRLLFDDSPKLSRVLRSIPSGQYELLGEHQVRQFALNPPFQSFFYQDRDTSYFVNPLASYSNLYVSSNDLLKFNTFFHPHVCAFVEALNQDGVSGLLTLHNQRLKHMVGFEERYHPDPDIVASPYPSENVDFLPDGAYSLYNWELFFHIPLLIATRLSQNQRFEEAQHWFHYIFDPTDDSSDPPPKRFWKVRTFYENNERGRIEDLLKLLDYQGNDPKTLDRKSQFEKQVTEWRDKPFDPHLIARLRPVAYQKTVVMKYIDNLIAWGDYLFSQDTMESVNQATQLYVLASDILGSRPQSVPGRGAVQIRTYHDLKKELDDFSNVLVALENQFPVSTTPATFHETLSVVTGMTVSPEVNLTGQLVSGS